MNKIWILSPWIWSHSRTGEKLYLVYWCNHRPQLQFMGLSYYNFRKDKYFFLQEFNWRASSREDGQELWSLLSFLGDQTSGPFFVDRAWCLLELNTSSLRIVMQAVDFLPHEGEVQGSARNLVFFSTKLLMIETLRDPTIQRKYPNLAILKNCLAEK